MGHLGCWDCYIRWKLVLVGVEQAIIVAFVQAEAKLYPVGILVEMLVVEVEEVGLLADLEKVVQEAP